MIAVCNTSPISSLIQIGHVTLLEKLFTELWIPPEVATELDDGVEFLGDWRTAAGAATIRTRSIQNQALLREPFAIDVLACPRCGGRLRLIATLHDPAVIRRILAHLAPGPAPPEPTTAAP